MVVLMEVPMAQPIISTSAPNWTVHHTQLFGDGDRKNCMFMLLGNLLHR